MRAQAYQQPHGVPCTLGSGLRGPLGFCLPAARLLSPTAAVGTLNIVFGADVSAAVRVLCVCARIDLLLSPRSPQELVLVCSDGTQLPIGRPTAPYTYNKMTAPPVRRLRDQGWIPR
jgi:hypothetical protein